MIQFYKNRKGKEERKEGSLAIRSRNNEMFKKYNNNDRLTLTSRGFSMATGDEVLAPSRFYANMA